MSTNASEHTALLALGNFWEPEYEFSKMHGVLETEAGYTGGTSANPTYHNIGDHSEAVRVDFDPHTISYEELLEKFWKLHEPTAEYEPKFRSAIFYFDETWIILEKIFVPLQAALLALAIRRKFMR